MRRRILTLVAVAVASPALSACGGADAGSSGIPMLRGERLGAERAFRVGSDDDPEMALTYFGPMAMDEDGRIYTAHPQESTIRVFSADGTLLRRIGREGGGPGEFRRLGWIGFLGDTLWANDASAGRFILFDRQGQHLGVKRIPFEMPQDFRELRIAPARADRLLKDGTAMGAERAFVHPETGEMADSSAIVRLDDDGAVLDTLVFQSHTNTVHAIRPPGGGPGGWFFRQPWSHNPIVRISSRTMELVQVARPVAQPPRPVRITRSTLEGDTLWSREYRYEPLSITEDQIETVVAERVRSIQNARGPQSVPEGRLRQLSRDGLYIPAHLPAVSDILMGRDGSMWLRLEETRADTVAWALLDPDGEPIGWTTLPARLRVMAADRNTLWGMELDELDVPYLVAWRVGGTDR